MKTAKAVLRERRRMRRAGFTGSVFRVLSQSRDGAHYMRTVLYTFPQAPMQTYVELWESHDRRGRARIVLLSDLIHLVQNASEREFWCIAGRPRPR